MLPRIPLYDCSTNTSRNQVNIVNSKKPTRNGGQHIAANQRSRNINPATRIKLCLLWYLRTAIITRRWRQALIMGPNFLTCARGVDDTVLQRIYTSRKQHKRTATLEGFHRIARRPPASHPIFLYRRGRRRLPLPIREGKTSKLAARRHRIATRVT